MLRAISFQSDNLRLREQVDRDTGFEESVPRLTQSYASYLSAIRCRGSLGDRPGFTLS